ncbi:glycosyltransferase family 4 protein [Arthrobacter sp. MI7-26]|uniref:exopolysaccharide biosynthesis GT4 family glycosyltransferase EpsE n=1 Tax=Arthrobacter sp. MI7-26 TaxID=2993653 RepID=UPI0022499987|nr:exopolysaccharide biosynthesis GT4 family glycosyltransferase EpsE [Arthrobacter sp. MI7-26]MCX2750279.1 glycosyltransferase family 4 protein [Arthrobacter sp. MI7-26]
MSEMHVDSELRFGYLVPEFPGQTHGFFWRELGVLKQLHISPDVVSTRSPTARSATQEWADEAHGITTYLAPFSLADFVATAGELLRMSPRAVAGILRVARTAFQEEAQFERPRGQLRAFMGQVGWVVIGVRLAALARDRDWRHVHVHSCGNSAYVAMYANLVAGLPYSLTLHGPLTDYGRNQQLKWAHAAFAIVITEGLRREVEVSLGPCLPGAVEVTPMGVDVREFSRDEPYEPWSGEGPFRIFSCGRLNPSKGHDVLLGAMHRMVRSGADVQLTIAGEDEAGGAGYRQELERLKNSLGLNDRVRLLGAVPAAAVRLELKRAHVFTLASHAEPLGVAIMEAMSMGVPVVVTGAGGVAELVEDRVSGLLVEPGSPKRLADSILEVKESPSLGLKLGNAGRNRVETSFRHQGSAEVLAGLIRATASAQTATSD